MNINQIVCLFISFLLSEMRNSLSVMIKWAKHKSRQAVFLILVRQFEWPIEFWLSPLLRWSCYDFNNTLKQTTSYFLSIWFYENLKRGLVNQKTCQELLPRMKESTNFWNVRTVEHEKAYCISDWNPRRRAERAGWGQTQSIIAENCLSVLKQDKGKFITWKRS